MEDARRNRTENYDNNHKRTYTNKLIREYWLPTLLLLMGTLPRISNYLFIIYRCSHIITGTAVLCVSLWAISLQVLYDIKFESEITLGWRVDRADHQWRFGTIILLTN